LLEAKTLRPDIESMRRPEFPHREARAIIGVTDRTLQTWNARGLVPSEGLQARADALERGAGRKYSVVDLVYLSLVKVLIRYVGQFQAAAIAATSIPIIAMQAGMMSFVETDDPSQTDCGVFLVIYPRETGGFGADLVATGFAAGLTDRPQEKADSLKAWIRAAGHDDVLVINIFAITRRLFAGMAAVRAQRKVSR
jgi:hypothetical protein